MLSLRFQCSAATQGSAFLLTGRCAWSRRWCDRLAASHGSFEVSLGLRWLAYRYLAGVECSAHGLPQGEGETEQRCAVCGENPRSRPCMTRKRQFATSLERHDEHTHHTPLIFSQLLDQARKLAPIEACGISEGAAIGLTSFIHDQYGQQYRPFSNGSGRTVQDCQALRGLVCACWQFITATQPLLRDRPLRTFDFPSPLTFSTRFSRCKIQKSRFEGIRRQ